jgi:hypothetical protein
MDGATGWHPPAAGKSGSFLLGTRNTIVRGALTGYRRQNKRALRLSRVDPEFSSERHPESNPCGPG